jgi:hypothetical protein
MCSRSDLLNGVYAEVFCKTTVTGVDSSTLRREDCSPHAMGDDPLGEASIPAYLWNQAGVGRGSGGVDLAREGGPGHASVQELGMRAGPGMGGEGSCS